MSDIAFPDLPRVLQATIFGLNAIAAHAEGGVLTEACV